MVDLVGATIEELTYRGPLFLIISLPFFKNHPLLFKVLLTAALIFSTLHFAMGHACPPHPLWISIVLTTTVYLTKSFVPTVAAHAFWSISLRSNVLTF